MVIASGSVLLVVLAVIAYALLPHLFVGDTVPYITGTIADINGGARSQPNDYTNSVSSSAPNAFSASFCAAVIPVAPVIFMPV